MLPLLCLCLIAVAHGGIVAHAYNYTATKVSDSRLMGTVPPTGSDLAQGAAFWGRIRGLGRSIQLGLDANRVAEPFSANGELLVAYNDTHLIVKVMTWADEHLWATDPMDQPWKDDSFECFLDVLNDRTQTMEADDFKWFITGAGHISTTRDLISFSPDGLHCVFVANGTLNQDGDSDVGFESELHFSLASVFDVQASLEGSTMGFNVVLNDRDSSDTATRGRSWWSGPGSNLNVPSSWGSIYFEPPATSTSTATGSPFSLPTTALATIKEASETTSLTTAPPIAASTGAGPTASAGRSTTAVLVPLSSGIIAGPSPTSAVPSTTTSGPSNESSGSATGPPSSTTVTTSTRVQVADKTTSLNGSLMLMIIVSVVFCCVVILLLVLWKYRQSSNTSSESSVCASESDSASSARDDVVVYDNISAVIRDLASSEHSSTAGSSDVIYADVKFVFNEA